MVKYDVLVATRNSEHTNIYLTQNNIKSFAMTLHSTATILFQKHNKTTKRELKPFCVKSLNNKKTKKSFRNAKPPSL